MPIRALVQPTLSADIEHAFCVQVVHKMRPGTVITSVAIDAFARRKRTSTDSKPVAVNVQVIQVTKRSKGDGVCSKKFTCKIRSVVDRNRVDPGKRFFDRYLPAINHL